MDPRLILARETDTKNMLADQRSEHIQETLVICKRCRARPVFYVFAGKGAEDGICLTCWEVTRR